MVDPTRTLADGQTLGALFVARVSLTRRIAGPDRNSSNSGLGTRTSYPGLLNHARSRFIANSISPPGSLRQDSIYALYVYKYTLTA